MDKISPSSKKAKGGGFKKPMEHSIITTPDQTEGSVWNGIKKNGVQYGKPPYHNQGGQDYTYGTTK